MCSLQVGHTILGFHTNFENSRSRRLLSEEDRSSQVNYSNIDIESTSCHQNQNKRDRTRRPRWVFSWICRSDAHEAHSTAVLLFEIGI